MRLSRSLLAGAVLLGMVGTAQAGDPYVYGPAPDWHRYVALAEPAIRAMIPETRLGDAAGYTIVWPNGYVATGWMHRGHFRGYLSCGYLQPVTPGEGRHRTNFAVVIDHDQVQTVDISSHERNSLVNMLCDDLISRGRMPPASLMKGSADPAADLTANKTVDGLGLTLTPMAEGAYVVEAAAGSRGARAGLKAGMVLTRVNGIPLANMGPAMIALLAADSVDLEIETVTGQHVAVRKGP